MIRDNSLRCASRPAMRFQDGATWRTISYAELGQRIRSAAKALIQSGVRAGDMVGIFSPNRPEWTIADFAILSVGAVSVPIYPTNTVKQARYVVDDAGISVIFVGEQAQYDKVVAFRPDTPQLTSIIAFDTTTSLTGENSEHFADLLARGSASTLDEDVTARIDAGASTDVATLIYTSGTTGDPKGAVLTHANFFHQVRALDERFNVGPGDNSLCFLPLSHAYERAWSFYVFARGAENCYLADPRKVVEAMADVRPSIMVSVPRLYEKIYATVLDRVDRGSAVKAKLFHWAIGVGGRYQHRRASGGSINPVLRAEHALADRLALSKVREVVGGEKRVFAAGGAPLNKDIEEFFFAAGGEIQIRGGNVMIGYHGKPEDTAAAFEDGWFKTGDQGAFDADGFLLITDRIKDIIITSQGKNVSPQRIESLLATDPFIEQLIVVGDRRTYLSALIEPVFPILERHAREHGISYTSRAELVAHPLVVARYESRIRDLSQELANYEQVKRYTLVDREFTQERGQLLG